MLESEQRMSVVLSYGLLAGSGCSLRSWIAAGAAGADDSDPRRCIARPDAPAESGVASVMAAYLGVAAAREHGVSAPIPGSAALLSDPKGRAFGGGSGHQFVHGLDGMLNVPTFAGVARLFEDTIELVAPSSIGGPMRSRVAGDATSWAILSSEGGDPRVSRWDGAR